MEWLDDEVRRAIDNSVLGWLATVGPEGQPSVSPKEVFTEFESTLLVAMIASPQTMRNVRVQPKVCFSMVDVFVQTGVQLYGRGRLLNQDDQEFDRLQLPLQAIAGPKFPVRQLLQIEVSGKKSIIAPRYRFFPDTTEQDQIDAAMQRYHVLPQPTFCRDAINRDR